MTMNNQQSDSDYNKELEDLEAQANGAFATKGKKKGLSPERSQKPKNTKG